MVEDQFEQEHLNPTDEISLETVKTRAVKGVVVLTGRTFFLSVLSLVATGFLTVFLDPTQFGVFWIVSAIVNFLTYFSDIGLAAALIQKKEKPTRIDLGTTFTIQQILVILLLLILYFANPILARFYSLTTEGRILLMALGVSFFLSGLKTIPSILMERELQFGKLVIPQVLENLVYNVVAVVLAWKGFGIRAFTYAVLARGVIGLISIYILRPWVPLITFSKKSIKKLLSFGVPYQANTLLATLKDDGMTAVLGTILGPAGIGYLGWAQKWGYAPLRFFMDHVVKVTFPAFSRMQDNKDELTNSVNRSLFFIAFLVFPTLAGLLASAPLLVAVIPKYEKWVPALIPLFLIGVNTLFAAVTTQLTNLLNSIGRIKTTFKLMIMWSVLTWVFVPVLAYKFSVIGAAAGYALVGLSSIIAIIVVFRYVKFSLKQSVMKPFYASLIMGVFVLLIREKLPATFATFWIMLASGVIIYALLTYLFVGRSLVNDVKRSFKTFFTK